MSITRTDIREGAGVDPGADVSFSSLRLLDSPTEGTLSFVDDDKYLGELARNPNISGVFVTPALGAVITRAGLQQIPCDDPRYCFYALHNFLARKRYRQEPSVIDPTAEIHPRAFVSEYNVRIGKNVRVEPSATILPDVRIGDDCLVGAGAVIGCDDAEIKVTSRGTLRVFHDGKLFIGDRVEIGANCTVDKGFSHRDTIIGDDTKLANATFVGHAAHIGKNCRLLCCTVLGSVTVKDNVRINPGAVVSNQLEIGENAVISLGAIVVRSVPAKAKVSGNFAVDHGRFIYEMAKVYGKF